MRMERGCEGDVRSSRGESWLSLSCRPPKSSQTFGPSPFGRSPKVYLSVQKRSSTHNPRTAQHSLAHSHTCGIIDSCPRPLPMACPCPCPCSCTCAPTPTRLNPADVPVPGHPNLPIRQLKVAPLFSSHPKKKLFSSNVVHLHPRPMRS